MPLKRHHKIIIGSLSSLVIIFMIVGSVLIYVIFIRQNLNYISLDNKISDLQTDTQTKINDLTTGIMELENELITLGAQVGTIDEDISLLKASTSADFSGIIESSIPAVITIITDISQGSGFIISEEGYVVTNAHILEGISAANIVTYDGKRHTVRLVGVDDLMDVALLKIEPETAYEPLELADSDKVSIGEKVIAIGNPLGLQFSVSEGIVSAVHREGPNSLEAYIQTDAALNPGNSGGPLINKEGKVIGINNFKIGTGENLGFALESNFLKEAVNDIAQQALNQDLIS